MNYEVMGAYSLQPRIIATLRQYYVIKKKYGTFVCF